MKEFIRRLLFDNDRIDDDIISLSYWLLLSIAGTIIFVTLKTIL